MNLEDVQQLRRLSKRPAIFVLVLLAVIVVFAVHRFAGAALEEMGKRAVTTPELSMPEPGRPVVVGQKPTDNGAESPPLVKMETKGDGSHNILSNKGRITIQNTSSAGAEQ